MSRYRTAFAGLVLLATSAYADTISGDFTANGVNSGNVISGSVRPPPAPNRSMADVESQTQTADGSVESATATQSGSGSVITGGISGNACPDNQVNFNNGGDQSYCCPGAVYGENDNPFCCVGADYEVSRPTFASCFPTCSGTTEDSGVPSTTSQACSTTIFLSESNYSSLAQAAATSLSSESGGSSGSGSSAAASSGGSSASTTSASTSGQSTASGSAASSTGSEGAAVALMTSGPMAGALIAAGGFILAL